MNSQTPSLRLQAAQAAAQAIQAYEASDFSLAEDLFAQAASLDPAVSSYRCNLATARLSQGKNELALSALERTIDPLDAVDCATLGLVLKISCAGPEAMAWLRRALLLDPSHAAARINLSNLLMADGQYEEAIQLMRQGVVEAPGHWPLLNNLGLALHEGGALDEALQVLEQAQSLAPASQAIALNRAHTLLMMGRWREGFAAYEARVISSPPMQTPRWSGEALPGQTLLVLAEQGLGDTLQFARLLSRAADRVGRLILSCDKTLHRLFEGFCVVADEAGPLPAHDVHCPLLSLPKVLELDAPDLYAEVPYIKTPPPFILDGAFKVGFVWAGRKGHANDKNRSLDPALLEPLTRLADISCYSLQIGRGEPPSAMIHLAPGISDLYDTARAIAGLDLLISVDTAPAHLAGAMGRPVWTLLPFAPDWRWGPCGETTPWYPSMRLFRQQRPGDWAGVIERVATTLGTSVGSGNPNPTSSCA